jgi:hypothetical protein
VEPVVPSHYEKYGKKWYENNRESELERNRKYYQENKEAKKARHRVYVLKGRYGLTEDQYLEMVDKRNGKCDICDVVYTKTLNVDHNHKTGEVRGLLCNNCNRGLGHLKDSIEILESAIYYLKSCEISGKGGTCGS